MNLQLKTSEELAKEAFELPVSVYRPDADEPQKFTLVCEELDQPAMDKIMKQPRADLKLLTRGSSPHLQGTRDFAHEGRPVGEARVQPVQRSCYLNIDNQS